jgi:hypothetical protein
MRVLRGVLAATACWLVASSVVAAAEPPPAGARLRAALLTAEMATSERLAEFAKAGQSTIVLVLDDDSPSGREKLAAAAKRVAEARLTLEYWIEIGHCPELADTHPQWMASLQGHSEWRRMHKDFPEPKANEVVKNYPWVPVLYREAFEAQLSRVKRLLADRSPGKGVWLNDLQGPPSACGCGNPVCRWTPDYGPIKTATPLGDDAAAKFVADVGKLVPAGTRVVPVWTTECEEHDVAKDALCAGVGCYKGICWKAYTRQLTPLADESPLVGVLGLYKSFGQDTPFYKQTAGWVRTAVRGFQLMPPQHGGRAIEPQRLLMVVQGFDVTADELAAQMRQAEEAGAAGIVVAYAKIDQSWQPRMYKWR